MMYCFNSKFLTITDITELHNLLSAEQMGLSEKKSLGLDKSWLNVWKHVHFGFV